MNTDLPNSPIAMSADRPSAPSDTWNVEPADTVAAPTSLIVPLDGSRFARRALPVAIHVARMLHADIHLLSVVATASYVERRQAELAEIPFPPGCRVHRTVLVGLAPADAIHETRRRLQPGLVCMASHGRGRSAALAGSVALDVVARGCDPVIVVGPAFDGRVAGHRLVACVDSSPASGAFVAAALGWARLLGLHLTVVTVAELVPEPLRKVPVRRRFGPDGDVDAYLSGIMGSFRHDGHDVDAGAVFEPISVSEGVRRYLRIRPASLVAVTSHARTGFSRFVHGSATADIVFSSPVAVLVLPGPSLRSVSPGRRDGRSPGHAGG